MKRCFIAFSLPKKIAQEVIAVQDELIAANPEAPVKWSKREHLHITVEFLGDLEDVQIEAIRGILPSLTNDFYSFPCKLSIVDAFPNLHHPQVLIMRVNDLSRLGHQLQAALRHRLTADGLLKDTRPWHAHITLGRVKSRWSPKGVEKTIVPALEWTADRIVFYESRLGAAGHDYLPIEEYSLK